jgi:hypothetical protein
LQAEWTEKVFQAAGSIELPPMPEYEGVVFPAEDTQYDVTSTCDLDGTMMRYSYSGHSLQYYNKGELEYREYISASDGKVSKLFLPLPNPLRDYPKGIIMEGTLCTDAATLNVWPLLLTFRAVDPALGWPTRPWRLLNRDLNLDGHTCVEVAYSYGSSQHHVWADVEREYLPLRYFVRDLPSGKMTTDISIEFTRGQSDDWEPIRWTLHQPGDGALEYAVQATVTAFAVNEQIPLSNFQIEFPEGTVVIDMRNDGERFEVGPNNEKRVPHDRSSVIRRSEVSHLSHLWLYANVLAILLILGIVVYRRMYRVSAQR